MASRSTVSSLRARQAGTNAGSWPDLFTRHPVPAELGQPGQKAIQRQSGYSFSSRRRTAWTRRTPTTPDVFRLVILFFMPIGGGSTARVALTHFLAAASALVHVPNCFSVKFFW